jgi:cytochrome c biogenesis protein CcmG, thiol:disulfide interchange protein DsbE
VTSKPSSPGVLAVLVLVLIGGFALLPRLFKAPGSALDGKEAPDFTLDVVANENPSPASGASLTLSQLRGKPVLLDFWATWCGPCQEETPMVDKVAKRYRDRGLVVVGVNTSDVAQRARPFAERNRISFPIVFDTNSAVASGYGVENLPTLVLVSRAGKVLAVRTGITDDSELESLVKEAL